MKMQMVKYMGKVYAVALDDGRRSKLRHLASNVSFWVFSADCVPHEPHEMRRAAPAGCCRECGGIPRPDARGFIPRSTKLYDTQRGRVCGPCLDALKSA